MVPIDPADKYDSYVLPGLVIRVGDKMHYAPSVGFLRGVMQHRGTNFLVQALRNFGKSLTRMLARRMGERCVDE